VKLNAIKPARGSKHAKKRVGRGFACHGKTAGRGHKGQKSRAGGYHKVGFEGGQMPLQRRLPKRGFVSAQRYDTAEVRLSDLQKIAGDVIDLAVLKNAGVIHHLGEIKRKVALMGLLVSKGARAAIEAAGGNVELPSAQPPAGKLKPKAGGESVPAAKQGK